MIDWLKSQKDARPERVGTSHASLGDAARITTNVEHAQVILTGKDGDRSLVLEDGGTCAIPAGYYAVRTTRVTRVRGDVPWFVSWTGPHANARRFAAGKTTRIELDPSVHFTAHAKRAGRQLRLGFAIKASDGRGLSVYRDWKRIQVRYEIHDEQGEVLATGTMRYG